MRESFSSSCGTPGLRSHLLPHSLPVLDFDSVRFLLPLEDEVASLSLSLFPRDRIVPELITCG